MWPEPVAVAPGHPSRTSRTCPHREPLSPSVILVPAATLASIGFVELHLVATWKLPSTLVSVSVIPGGMSSVSLASLIVDVFVLPISWKEPP